MCVGFSFGGCTVMMTNKHVLAQGGRSAFKSQTCERCVCLHKAVVMQALMKLAEDVSLCVSDQRLHGYSVSLFTQANKTVFLGNA